MMYLMLFLLILMVVGLFLFYPLYKAAHEDLEDGEVATVGAHSLRRPKGYSFVQRPLLSATKLKFYDQLQKAAPNYLVLPQIALSAMIEPSKNTRGTARTAAFATISQKRSNFALCHPDTLKIALLVELDDRTHDAVKAKLKDKARDDILLGAGIKVLRYSERKAPDMELLQHDLAIALRSQEVAQEAELKPVLNS